VSWHASYEEYTHKKVLVQPGPVDNWRLIENGIRPEADDVLVAGAVAPSDYFTPRVKGGLRHEEVVPLSETQYLLLQRWYGGGPALVRPRVPGLRVSTAQLASPALFPIQLVRPVSQGLTQDEFPNVERTAFWFCGSSKLKDLKWWLCSKLSVPPARHRLRVLGHKGGPVRKATENELHKTIDEYQVQPNDVVWTMAAEDMFPGSEQGPSMASDPIRAAATVPALEYMPGAAGRHQPAYATSEEADMAAAIAASLADEEDRKLRAGGGVGAARSMPAAAVGHYPPRQGEKRGAEYPASHMHSFDEDAYGDFSDDDEY
jgi:hypothetical protein